MALKVKAQEKLQKISFQARILGRAKLLTIKKIDGRFYYNL